MRGLRTGGALLATTALTLTTLGAGLAPATAAPAKSDRAAADLAASWLEGQLTDGLVRGQFGPDYGLSIDIALGLDEVGDTSTVRTISNAVAAGVESYVSGGTFDPGSTYAGATAKAATLARVAGGNPTSYGGVNLVSRLESRVSSTAPIVGRIEDKSTFGDYANVVGQSFAARALVEAGSQRAGDAVAFLLQQQCAGGWFRLDLTKSKTSTAQGCVDGAPDSGADLDATSLVVMNLAASGEKSPAVKAALAKAGTWLAAQQAGSGAFGVVGSSGRYNTNSTGLAGWALASLGDKDAAADAAVWVRKRQPIDLSRCRSALTKSTGAVAYDDAAVKAARTAGLTPETTDQWVRATAQALPVLQWAPAAATDLDVVGRTVRAEAGSKVRFRTLGIAPGERACIAVKGDFKRLVGKANGGKVSAKLEMPNGSKLRKVKAKTSDSIAKTVVRVS